MNTEVQMIKDSGNRREFQSGAVRDIEEGKGRCDLTPIVNVARFLNRDAVLYAIGEYVATGEIEPLYIALENFVFICLSICLSLSFNKIGCGSAIQK